MSSSTPDFNDTTSLIGDYLAYPRRVLLQAMQEAFASPHFFTKDGDKLNPFLYVVEEDGTLAQESKIEIADGWTDELDKTDPRPIILCQRDTLSFVDTGLAAHRKVDLPHGAWKQFASMVDLPLSFLCFAREHVVADVLGLTVGMMLKLFKEELRNQSKIFAMQNPIVGPPTPIRTDSKIDLFSVPVSVMTKYSIAWKMTWTDLKLAKDFSTNIKLPESASV